MGARFGWNYRELANLSTKLIFDPLNDFRLDLINFFV